MASTRMQFGPAGSSSSSRSMVSVDPSRSGYSHPPQSQDGGIASHNRYTPRPQRSDSLAIIMSDDDDAELMDEIIMAINHTDRGLTGCAYYVARTETLFCMQDLKAGDSTIVDSLKLYVDPTVVLLPINSSADVVKSLDPHRIIQASDDRYTDCTHLSYLLDTRPTAEFSYQNGMKKLASLEIEQMAATRIDLVENGAHPGEQQDSRQGQLLRLGACMDIESKLTVGCAGAILLCLQRRRGTTYLPHDERARAAYRISSITMFTLADSMLITTETLHSLQITSTQSHPNAQQQGPSGRASSRGAKEGLSVYGLFHHQAKTPQGRIRLRQCFHRPSMDVTLLEERLNIISSLIRPENTERFNSIRKNLGKIKNMHQIMERLEKGANTTGRFASSTWATIRHFAFHTLSIAGELAAFGSEDMALFRRFIAEANVNALAEIGRLINGIIDIDVSHEQNRTSVRAGVDSELDNARSVYAGLEDLLAKVARHFSESIPLELNAQLNVIFFPQIGFLVSVRLDSSTGSGVYEGLDQTQWDKVFVTETAAYYKNDTTAKLDEQYGDVYGKVRDREIEIIHALAERVLQHHSLLLAVSDQCGELDCMMAMAAVATQYNLARPALTEDNIIQVRQGRHILQELTVPSFVANDTNMVDTNMIIMTGPNYSGKSIYLKQVALIVYMAHIGSFVPAESAVIGLTDKILTRISTRESVSRLSSAFMTDLQQVSIALNLATPRSLLILDEFGKGTDSHDGAGLAAGVYEHLLKRADRSRVLAATHFHEIFETGFVAPQPGLEFAHMKVMIDADAEPNQQVTYLYSYEPTRSIQSFGTCCAAMNGISTTIVQRAESLILSMARSGNLVDVCAAMPERELAELETAEEIARKFLSLDVLQGGHILIQSLLE